MRGYKRGLILIVLLGIILLALSGSSTMVQNVSASTTYNILWMVGAVGSTSLSTSEGTSEQSNLFDVSGESITWPKGDWASNWWATVDASSWIVNVWVEKPSSAAAKITIEIGLTGKTSLTYLMTVTTIATGNPGQQATPAFGTLGWADRDASTTWLNDGTGSRTLHVKITQSVGTCTVYWGSAARNSRMNTGIIVPENLLVLLFVVPAIPLLASRAAERGRVKKASRQKN